MRIFHSASFRVRALAAMRDDRRLLAEVALRDAVAVVAQIGLSEQHAGRTADALLQATSVGTPVAAAVRRVVAVAVPELSDAQVARVATLVADDLAVR